MGDADGDGDDDADGDADGGADDEGDDEVSGSGVSALEHADSSSAGTMASASRLGHLISTTYVGR